MVKYHSATQTVTLLSNPVVLHAGLAFEVIAPPSVLTNSS